VNVKFGLDTSCIVPLLSVGHMQHAPTLEEYTARLRRAEQPVIPVQALLESYSVLTRSPAPLFISPQQVRRMLVENFADVAEFPALSPNQCWAGLDELAARSLGGGLIYDAVIADSCRQAGAQVLLTWNVRDFLRVAPIGLEIRQP